MDVRVAVVSEALGMRLEYKSAEFQTDHTSQTLGGFQGICEFENRVVFRMCGVILSDLHMIRIYKVLDGIHGIACRPVQEVTVTRMNPPEDFPNPK